MRQFTCSVFTCLFLLSATVGCKNNLVVNDGGVQDNSDLASTDNQAQDNLNIDSGLPRVKFSPAEPVNLQLGKSQVYKYTLTSINGFSGNVELSVERDELDDIDAESNIEIELSTNQASLAVNATMDIMINVNVKSAAPSFDAEHFHVVAVTGEASTLSLVNLEVELAVKAIYDIELLGGNSPEDWSSPKVLNFVAHKDGLKIRFINMDQAATHVIHGKGKIRHGNRSNPLAVSAGNGLEGGVYEIMISEAEGNSLGNYYCHNHEGGAVERTINFNIDL